jgi:hypothetical protein
MGGGGKIRRRLGLAINEGGGVRACVSGALRPRRYPRGAVTKAAVCCVEASTGVYPHPCAQLIHHNLLPSLSSHSAPMRQPACQDAERAVLACDPRSDPNQCDDAVRAYVRCADALTFRLMNPGRE